MCLAVPARVLHCLAGERALIDLDGVQMDISTELLDEVQVGDYVIVHVGYAIGKLDPDEALLTLQSMAEMANLTRLAETSAGHPSSLASQP